MGRRGGTRFGQISWWCGGSRGGQTATVAECGLVCADERQKLIPETDENEEVIENR